MYMPRRKDPKDKKNLILSALNQCLYEKPFDKTSIKDIARAAGVNHGLLHYYFKNKEDILIQYIQYVIDHYKSLFGEWLAEKQTTEANERQLIEEFFQFMNTRITLDRRLSKVFIEIWEIASYNPNVRKILQQAYLEWMDVLAGMLKRLTGNREAARLVSIATVAFLEGLALFSIILTPETFDINEVLTGFQKKIIQTL